MLIFDQDINQALKDQLDRASVSVEIIMYSISPPSKSSHAAFKLTWQAMIRAASRVENFRAILCGWPSANPQQAASAEAARLLESSGAVCILAQPGTIYHPKAWCFDHETLLIGSHNATQAGFTTTRNISYIGQDQSEIAQFRVYFENQWQNIARQIKRA